MSAVHMYIWPFFTQVHSLVHCEFHFKYVIEVVYWLHNIWTYDYQ